MLDSDDLDESIKWLLDNDLISMGWSEEKEEIIYFMTEPQKAAYDLQAGGWE